MVNIGLLIGTGNIGEDSLKINPLIKNISNHSFYIASRINEDVHLNEILKNYVGNEVVKNIKENIGDLRNNVKDFSIIYDSQYLKEKYDKSDITELEKWIGIPFNYISSMDRRFYNRKKMRDIRDSNELNNYIAGLINYFKDFFGKNNIDIFINTIEDDVFSVIAYFVAKKLDITIIGFMPGRFPIKGNMFCKNFNSVLTWNDQEHVEWEQIESLYSHDTMAQKDLQDRNKKLLKLNFSIFIKNIKTFFIYKNYVKGVVKEYPYEKFIFEDIHALNEIKKFLTKFIRSRLIKLIISHNNIKDSYFLFPLHFMEDAQITFREPFLEQVEIIKKIIKALPSGYQLYIKPHPHYFGTDISFKEILSLYKIKNLKVIDPSLPPIKLLKNSKGVITVNSTTGFEALINNIPVITFGHDFYCNNDLCHVIRDINDLPLKLVDSQVNKKDRYKIKEFVKKVYLNTIWIDRSGYTYDTCGLTKNDGKKLAKSLNLIIDSMQV